MQPERPSDHERTPAAAAAALAALAGRELDTFIEPERLIAFLRSYWFRVSYLAHVVHNPPRQFDVEPM